MGGSKVIRVTNIAPQATRDQMQTLLTFVGKVEEIKLYPTVRDVAIPVASRVSFVKFVDRDHVGIAQHLNNTVFIDRALIIVPYEKPDIPDEHTAMLALVQANGMMGLGVTSEQQLPAHVTNVVDGASYITKDPTFAEHGVPEYPSLPCTLEYGKVEEIRRTVVIGNLAPSTDAHQVMEWLADAGEIKYSRMCGRDTDESRACLIEFSDQAAVIPAMIKSGQRMGDRSLVVAHSSLGIAKPQIKTNEMAQREIEEAMRRAQEQQSLISSTMQPVTSYMDEAKRSRSRERGGRRRRSRSRDRRRSRSPHRSRGKYSPIRDRRRSRSRDLKSRSRRSRSRSRDLSKRSKHRTRSRSRDRRKDDKDKDRRGSSRDKDRRDKDKSRDKDKDKSRDKDKDRSRDKDKSDKSKSKESPEKMATDAKGSGDKSASLAKEKSSKDSSRARSRSPAKKRSRSRSADRRRGGRGLRSSPSRRRSRSRSRQVLQQRRTSRSPARRRSRSPGRKRSRSPRGSHSRPQRSPERDHKRRDRDKDHKRDKDRREKDSKPEKTDAKVSRDYDEEEKGFDEVKKSVSREASPARRSTAGKGKEEKSTPTGDDMDISE